MVTVNSHFTEQVLSLLDRVYGRSSLKDTILDQAINFFTTQDVYQEKHSKLKSALDEACQQLSLPKTDQKSLIQLQKKIESQLLDLVEQQKAEQEGRRKKLQGIAEELIALCEAENFAESNRKSAQCLGTIQLSSPTEGSKVATTNELSKPVYKAILSLRLLDYICMNKVIKDPYLTHFVAGIPKDSFLQFAQLEPTKYQRFLDYVKVPLVMAALIQDIGNYHPDARAILVGEDGEQDPYRTLEIEDRKALLQINYRETIKFLVEGIGFQKYVGNSRNERDQFDLDQRRKVLFIKQLLKGSIKPGEGIGNLLKVPQIYSSIVLSTKSSYNYKVLPKVYQALNQNAERKSCSQAIVDVLYKITGMFPQGYGITYIPNEVDGSPSNFYEYAIVTQLYPKVPEQPLCRIATRKLAFVGYGQDIEIAVNRNLYFIETTKKLANMSKARLNEILELLSSNYQERQDLDLLPRCWHTKDYFSIKNNQKLWNKRNN